VISGFINAYHIAIKTSSGIWLASRNYYGKAIRDPGIQKIAIEFCTEAAVLVAVFPILDTILGTPGMQPAAGGIKEVTWTLVVTSEGLAALLLFLASIMSLASGRKE
jgi:glycerol-3-phosphate acyltransferase PlsY